MLNKGVYTDKELNSLIGMELKSQMLDSRNDILRTNKLERITKMIISLNELDESKCKLYEELGWENLYHRRWYRRLTHFFKLRQSGSPLYLYNLIPPEREVNYNLRRIHVFDQRVERTNRYANTYFQNCPKEWNQLDVTLQSSQTISEFKR